MYASPISLQEACIECVTNNLKILCRPIQYSDGMTGLTAKLVFRDPDIYLHTEISEILLSSLCDRGKLTDLNMTLFDSKATRLR